MPSNQPVPKAAMSTGLDNVVAAQTALSMVDGKAGRLVIAGFDAEQLVKTRRFEDVVELLWAAAGDPARQHALAGALGRARQQAHEDLPAFLRQSVNLTVIEGLRAGLARLADEQPESDASKSPKSPKSDVKVRLVAAIPVYVAALCRQAEGQSPVAPDPDLSHAADYLRMLHGQPASPAQVAAMDTYLAMISDHGMNASTFAARVIASTQAGFVSSVVGALCALKGPLHGGAPGPVLDMLDEIGTPDRIAPWLEEQLAQGERLMGFGHRIYRVRDPRADILNDALLTLAAAQAQQGDLNRLTFARQVEREALAALRAAKPDRPLDTNVEFFTALILEALGVPRAAFTPTFAIGRVAGWTAHIIEQNRSGRLIRPQSEYIGGFSKNAA